MNIIAVRLIIAYSLFLVSSIEEAVVAMKLTFVSSRKILITPDSPFNFPISVDPVWMAQRLLGIDEAVTQESLACYIQSFFFENAKLTISIECARGNAQLWLCRGMVPRRICFFWYEECLKNKGLYLVPKPGAVA